MTYTLLEQALRMNDVPVGTVDKELDAFATPKGTKCPHETTYWSSVMSV
jgi:hypothetical protein